MFCCFCYSGHIFHKKSEKDAIDPVCGMHVNEKAAKYKVEYEGKTYYFCSSICESNFKKNPEKYVK